MRSAWMTGAKRVVSARPPTVWVGLSWLCSSGNSPLELLEPADHPVVCLVALKHLVALVVGVAQLEDPVGERLRLGLRRIELRDGVGVCHGLTLRRAPDAGTTPSTVPSCHERQYRFVTRSAEIGATVATNRHFGVGF